MEILPVTKDEYKEIVKNPIFYNSAEFNELNSYKVDELIYLVSKDSKYRFGVCLGRKGNEIYLPFSAPFGLVEATKHEWKLEQLEETISSIEHYLQGHGIKKIKIVLPPNFYDQNLITATQNILYRKKYFVDYIEMNYALNICSLYNDKYISNLPRNGRKNVTISLNEGLNLECCDTLDKKKEAYNIIQINRESKGYPLRMSWEQVSSTINIVNHDFFIVRYQGKGVAAAQVFIPAEKIAQVIYWGDCPGHGIHKPMNFLAYMLIQFYGKKNMNYLDIGPGSEQGIPNYGLCDYKKSIGCEISTKIAFSKEFT